MSFSLKNTWKSDIQQKTLNNFLTKNETVRGKTGFSETTGKLKKDGGLVLVHKKII